MPDFGFDDWIDAQLRNVPVPADLLSKLSKVGPGSPEEPNRETTPRDQKIRDGRLDAILRHVPVPRSLEPRLLRIAFHRRSPPLPWQIGLAAGLMIAVGVAVTGYFGLPSRGPSPRSVAQQPGRAAQERSAKHNAPPVSSTAPIVVPTSPSSAIEVAQDGVIHDGSAGSSPPQRESPQSRVAVPTPLPKWEDLARFTKSVQLAVEDKMRVQDALGAGGHLDRLPDLEVLEVPENRGITPPRVRGYDLLFQLKHGEHPFASPAAHPDLTTSRVPLTFRTASYDLALRNIQDGHLPAADEVRVEDFLAAFDYALPPAPTSGLALHVAGSPSPLKDGGLHLLQFTVQGAVPKTAPHSSKRLICVMDQSISMRKAARWEAVRHALAKIGQQMSETDRVTLIGFAEQPTVLANNATRGQFQALVTSDDLGSPSGLANFSLAIESAHEAAQVAKSSMPTTVLFLTAGRKHLDEAAMTHATQALGELADAGVAWEILRIAQGGTDPTLVELAEAAHGKVSDATSGAEIYDALLEKLTGRSSTVAVGASLKVSFDRQIVTGYRLLGHESATLTGGSTDPLEVDFHCGQTATGLYELWIKPTGHDVVATAELTWHDPKSGQLRRVAQTIRRAQFSKSFSQAPAWFQQGVIAAKTAEVLRGSYFAPSGNPWAQVFALTQQLDPAVAERKDFGLLLDLIRNADRLH